jgi:RNA polymerase sigma-70 factor (ECF subfamily)
MASEDRSSEDLVQRDAAGGDRAVNELFAKYRDRLRAMVRLQLNRRLQGRVDPSDVLWTTDSLLHLSP